MSRLRDDGGGRRGDGASDVGSDAGCVASPCPARPTCVVAGAWHTSAISKDVIDSATGDVLDFPPPADDVPELVLKLNQWMNCPHDVHPLIAIAIAPVQLVPMHPFRDGTVLTWRLPSMPYRYRASYGFSRLVTISGATTGTVRLFCHAVQRVWRMRMEISPWMELVARGLSTQLAEVRQRGGNATRLDVCALHAATGSPGARRERRAALRTARIAGWHAARPELPSELAPSLRLRIVSPTSCRGVHAGIGRSGGRSNFSARPRVSRQLSPRPRSVLGAKLAHPIRTTRRRGPR